MPLDVQRCRNELETELDHWTEPGAPGFDLWRHRMHALIGEILDPDHSLAIRLVGLTDRSGAEHRSRERCLGRVITQAASVRGS